MVDEVPGLFLALARPGTSVTVEVTFTSGHQLAIDLMLPDVVSALCLKASAWDGRFTDRDAVDLWRLLEAAYAAGVTADAWLRGAAATSAAEVLRRCFGRPGAPGLMKATTSKATRTRIVALVRQVVGSS